MEYFRRSHVDLITIIRHDIGLSLSRFAWKGTVPPVILAGNPLSGVGEVSCMSSLHLIRISSHLFVVTERSEDRIYK